LSGQTRRCDAVLQRELAVPLWTEIVADVPRQNTTARVDRLDGERLVLDGLGLARGFFHGDASSIGAGSYDSLAGRGESSQITTADIHAINRTMRARSSHRWWAPVVDRDLDWLSAIDPSLDLVLASDDEWRAAEGERFTAAALAAAIGPNRGPSVAAKVLHLKRPRLFPVLDDFVAVMLGSICRTRLRADASRSRWISSCICVPRARRTANHS